jgi:hypothetical protein
MEEEKYWNGHSEDRLKTREIISKASSDIDSVYGDLKDEFGELGSILLISAFNKSIGTDFGVAAERVREYRNFIYGVCAPFKVGDTVTLVSKVDFEVSYGWKCAETFLVPGAIGNVKSVHLHADRIDGRDLIEYFTVSVIWENQSWYSSGEKKIVNLPRDRWSAFRHNATSLAHYNG